MFLFCASDLAQCRDNEIKRPVYIELGGTFDPSTANIDMPPFLSVLLNQFIGHSQAHQKQLGQWNSMKQGAKK